MIIIKTGSKKVPVFRAECVCCGCIAQEDRPVLTIHKDEHGGEFALESCPQCNAGIRMFPYEEKLT